MSILVLVAVLVLLVLIFVARVSAARAQEGRRRLPPTGAGPASDRDPATPGPIAAGTSGAGTEALRPAPPGAGVAPEQIWLSAEAAGVPLPPGGSAPLPVLLEEVSFPDDLAMLTHGMAPADLERRLVLATRRDPEQTRALLDGELRRVGFEVGWVDDRHGAASRGDGALLVRLHPPVPPEAGNKPTGRKGRNAVPTRPDFPSAPLSATVVELELPGPAFDGLA